MSAQARDSEATAEELLVDGGWQVLKVEPEAVAANGNGLHTNGNGPTVELTAVFGHSNGHVPVPVNGNANGRYYDEAGKPQQPLFS